MLKKNLIKYDITKIHETYDQWPQIAKAAYQNESCNQYDFKNIDKVLFAGMGGSGTIGDIISSIMNKNINSLVIKNNRIRQPVNEHSLVVITSISGNTKESLDILKEAHRKKCKIVAFSSGGKMSNYCKKNNITFQNFEKFHSPRASLPSALFTVTKSLESQFKLKPKDILNSIRMLEDTQKNINSENLSTKNNPALKFANWISDFPVIYYPIGLRAAAIRFKNSLQENCKIHALREEVMEACHNGIMGWEHSKNKQCILLRGIDDTEFTKKRMEIIKKYFKQRQISFYEVISKRGDIFSKLMNLIYFLDYSTIYYAVLNKIDPGPLNSINYIKSHLKKD